MAADMTEFNLSVEATKRIEDLKAKYPDPRSAVMMALYVIQKEKGFISQDAVLWLSNVINIPPVHIDELITFYTMYYSKPVGQYHFQVCRTLSCALAGCANLTKCLSEKFGIAPGEVSADGKWSLEEVECLGSCGTAPAIQINDQFFENLDTVKLDQLISDLEKEKPDLRLSAIGDDFLKEFEKYSKSQI